MACKTSLKLLIIFDLTYKRKPKNLKNLEHNLMWLKDFFNDI